MNCYDALERMKNINDLRTSGKTLREIGLVFGITSERVRQILKEYKAIILDGGEIKRKRRHNYQDVLDWIVAYKRDHGGNSPSYIEIAMGCNVSSPSHVQYILIHLEKQGKITRLGVKSRSISVIQ